MTDRDVCELRKIYELQQDYEKGLQKGATFKDEVMIMAITPRKENSDGHAMAFYKNSNGEIFFFDVCEGCYKISNMHNFIVRNAHYSYGLAGLKA